MANFENMQAYLQEEDDEKEFMLLPNDATRLADFLLGKHFHPILRSLDANQERVQARLDKEHKLNNFKEWRRDMATQELNHWQNKTLTEDKEYDGDDYLSMATPSIPLAYPDWMDLDDFSRSALGEEFPSQALHARAITTLLNYTHSLHYKIDYLHSQILLDQGKDQGAEVEDLKARFPWLRACDDHVWLVTTGIPLQLARSAAVNLH
jgi:hypothetical protein